MPDAFEVFYNRCVRTGQGSRAYKRRIDFIVLHEKFGLLAIEVKGGKIRVGLDGDFEQYHPNKKRWTSIAPYAQVEKAAIELITDCKADGVTYWIPADVCVIFPNTLRRDITDTPQTLPDGTLCADDLSSLAVLVPTLFSKSAKGQAWDRDAFLDMRRRLQNMPEATMPESAIPKATKNEKLLREKDEARKPFLYVPPKREIPQEDAYDFTTATCSHYDAVDSYDFLVTSPTPSLPPPSVTLKGWQIAVAVMIGLAATLVFAWIFMHPFVQHVFSSIGKRSL